jgi:maltose alpha-D-glucosyltransferase/alpha-amylase
LLALPSDDPAFAPEIMTEAQAQALGVRVCRQLEGFESGQDLLAAVDELALLAIGQQRIRIHGDLHLGQVLVTAGDVMFIDFEGEPARSLAERRAKDLPLRDVAGVLRSFDYAAAAALRELTQADETVDDEVRLLFDRFRDSAVEAFLRGYAGIAGDPRGPLLDLYLIEKAAYEVDYEASNRPDWVDIPRGGLERIAARLLGRGR